MSIVFEQYNNIHKFIQDCEIRPSNGKTEQASKKDPDKAWFGMSYENALVAFANGMPERLSKIKDGLKAVKLATNVSTTKARPINYYYGSKPNVPAAIIGLPKSMRRIERQPQKVKAINILYDSGANRGTTSDDLENSGNTVIKLISYLELLGYRVNLELLVYAANKGSETALCKIKLKDYKDNLDLLKLTFPLTSAAMFRRFGFRWLETNPEIRKDWSYSYGSKLSKEETLNSLSKVGIDINNTYLINVTDCINSQYDYLKLLDRLKIKM